MKERQKHTSEYECSKSGTLDLTLKWGLMQCLLLLSPHSLILVNQRIYQLGIKFKYINT